MIETFEIKIGEKIYVCKIFYKIMDEFLAKSVQLKKLESDEEKEKYTRLMRLELITRMTVNPKLTAEYLDSEEASMDDHELGFKLIEHVGKLVEERYSQVKKKDTSLPD